MRLNYTYNTSTWRGVPKFACVDCAYNVLKNEGTMMEHCKRMGHGIDKFSPELLAEWLQMEQTQRAPLRRTMLGMMSWNTAQATEDAARQLYNEIQRLEGFGQWATAVCVDNGSKDGTQTALKRVALTRDCFHLICNDYNSGISKARNQIIAAFLAYERRPLDYLLFTDGDIEVVPYSVYMMLKYLECQRKVGVIGAYSSNYTMDRAKAAKFLLEIPESRVKHDIACAWTQYGLFRGELFRQGLKFDEAGPFGEPGWGFEDDDFYFQMLELHWENKYFGGMCYLHRNIRSSWPNMEADGIDPVKMFFKRKDYLIEKWKKRGLPGHMLQTLQAQQPPRRPSNAR